MLDSRSAAQKEFEQRLYFYGSFVKPPIPIQRKLMPEDIGDFFGDEPRCFREYDAFYYLKDNEELSMRFKEWVNKFERVATFDRSEGRLFDRGEVAIYDGVGGVTLFCNWTDKEYLSFVMSNSYHDINSIPYDVSYRSEEEKLIFIPSTLKDLVESENYLTGASPATVPGFKKYALEKLNKIRDEIIADHLLSDKQRDIVRDIVFEIDENNAYKLDVSVNISKRKVYVSPEFLRAAYVLSINTFNNADDSEKNLGSARQIVQLIKERKTGGYANTSIFGGSSPYYSEVDFVAHNYIYEKAFISNLAFIILHEMAHVYLEEPNNETLCDCYALASYPIRSIQVHRSLHLFEELVENALLSGNGHYWGVNNDVEFKERFALLNELKQASLEFSDCANYRR